MQTVAGILLLTFDISSVSKLITDKLVLWVRELIRLLPNIVLAALVLVLGLFVAKFARKIAVRIISRMSHSPTLNNLFGSLIFTIFIGITVFAVLSIVNLDKAVTSILAGAGIIGLALAFAFQDLAANLISGIFISFRKPLQVGDVVKLKDFMGTVQEINLRDTILNTFQGHAVVIPNKEVFQNAIENYSILHKQRFDLKVGVSYNDDLQKVKQVTLDAVKDIEGISKAMETTLFFYEFGESSINFSVRMWIDSADQLLYKKVGSEAIMRIKNAYDKNDIRIPYPVTTLDFGKGGKGLEEMQAGNKASN